VKPGPAYELRDLARAREILAVLARHGFGHVVAALPLHRIPGLGRIHEEGRVGEQLPAPRRLVHAMQELGPAFVKLGQMLSTRPDLLSEEFVKEFESLQDRVPPFPGEQAKQVVESELGASLHSVYAEFGDDPVASASIAQVHRARLPDGRAVAVKVQRPGIEQLIRSDVNILYLLAGLLEGQVDLGLGSPEKVVEAFDRAMSVEVDFVNEAANAERLAAALDAVDGVHVPKVLRPMSARRVLTLEWVDGTKLTSVAELKADRRKVMERLIEATYQQIFVAGFFHADPHPGNLVVDEEATLTYLDFGLVGHITPEMRDTLGALLVGVIFKDAQGLARTLYKAGTADGRVHLRDLSAEIDVLLERWAGTKLEEQDTGRLALEILDLARTHHLRMPEEFVVLARTQLALDGISRVLVPDWDMMAAVKPYAARLAAERMDPTQLGGELSRAALSALTVLKDLPPQVDQLLLDLERGKFQLSAETPAVDRLTETLDRIGRSVVFGMGVSAFLISSAILLGVLVIQQSAEHDFGLGELLLGFAVVASMLAASGLVSALLWNLFVRERLKGVRWSRFVGLIPGLAGRREGPGGEPKP
jgi:ubiquinone biosynthesis protein